MPCCAVTISCAALVPVADATAALPRSIAARAPAIPFVASTTLPLTAAQAGSAYAPVSAARVEVARDARRHGIELGRQRGEDGRRLALEIPQLLDPGDLGVERGRGPAAVLEDVLEHSSRVGGSSGSVVVESLADLERAPSSVRAWATAARNGAASSAPNCASTNPASWSDARIRSSMAISCAFASRASAPVRRSRSSASRHDETRDASQTTTTTVQAEQDDPDEAEEAGSVRSGRAARRLGPPAVGFGPPVGSGPTGRLHGLVRRGPDAALPSRSRRRRSPRPGAPARAARR